MGFLHSENTLDQLERKTIFVPHLKQLQWQDPPPPNYLVKMPSHF
jgi:hypothetical protein